MAISVTITRPKLETVNDFSFSISPDNPLTDGNKILLTMRLNNISSTPSTFSCTFVEDANTLTFTNSTGKTISSLVRLGDVVSGTNTPYAVGTYVTNISSVGNLVTLTVNDTAAISGTENLTFTLPEVDGTLYTLEIEHTSSGSNLVVKPSLYVYNGQNVQDADNDGVDEVDLEDASSKINLAAQTINIDTFLNNARLQRTNDL